MVERQVIKIVQAAEHADLSIRPNLLTLCIIRACSILLSFNRSFAPICYSRDESELDVAVARLQSIIERFQRLSVFLL